MSEGDTLKPGDLAAAVAEHGGGEEEQKVFHATLGDGFSLDEHLEKIQRQFLIRGMDEAEGVLAKASRLLGIKHYQTLDAQLERLGIDKSKWKR